MKAKRIYGFEPDYAVAPGDSLREVMDSLDMSQIELATRTGLTVQTLSRIFNDGHPISYETANRLELAISVPARFWNNLEAEYREQLAKMEERERLRDDVEWLKLIPTKELIDRGEIEVQSDKVLLLRETLGFYGVSSVDAWHSIWDVPAVAARRSPCFERRPGAASAWIRIGELKAQGIECEPYNKNKFKEAISSIRGVTPENPAVFEPVMKKLCADAGVALALVPKFKKVPWSGATKWISPTKAMILLNLRGKGEDKFWFSFFHEAGHILNDKKKDLLINDGYEDDPREKRANCFAADMLIPRKYNEDILKAQSAAALRRISQELGVSVGIVAGRYQRLTGHWDYHKKLIRTFNWN